MTEIMQHKGEVMLNCQLNFSSQNLDFVSFLKARHQSLFIEMGSHQHNKNKNKIRDCSSA
jgi:hypothetical protein